MAAGTPSTERHRTLVVGAAWVLGLGVAMRLVGYLASNPMTVTVLAAVLVSFAAGPAGVPFAKSGPRARRRMLEGVGLGGAVVLAVVGQQLLRGGAIAPVEVGGSALFGAVEALAVAFRDETWLRGIPLVHARRAGIDRRWAAAFVALASVAAVAQTPGVTPLGLVAVGAGGAASAALWLTGRDGWCALAFRFAWVWALDGLLAGDVLVVTGPGRLTSGAGLDGAAAVVATVAFVAVAVVAVRAPLPRLAATDDELRDAPDEEAG